MLVQYSIAIWTLSKHVFCCFVRLPRSGAAQRCRRWWWWWWTSYFLSTGSILSLLECVQALQHIYVYVTSLTCTSQICMRLSAILMLPDLRNGMCPGTCVWVCVRVLLIYSAALHIRWDPQHRVPNPVTASRSRLSVVQRQTLTSARIDDVLINWINLGTTWQTESRLPAKHAWHLPNVNTCRPT